MYLQAKTEPMIIMVFDLSVAFFHGNVRKTIYVVPQKDLWKRGKVWRLLKSLYGTRDASQVFATYVEEGLNGHGFQRNVVVPCLNRSTALETFGVHWGDDFIFAVPCDLADELEQVMREVFNVKIFERVGPGFTTSVAFLKHTVAMAETFGFDGKKQLKQTKWHVTVAPRSKTVGKGMRDGAGMLNEEEIPQYRSLVGTALYVG